MKAGDPFETKDLDELRARQRRSLRMVPDWLFNIYAPSDGPSAVPPDVIALLESELRSEAENARKELDDDLLTRMEEHTRKEMLVDFMSRHDTAVRLESAFRAMPSRIFGVRVTELRAEFSRVAIHEGPEPEAAASLARYVRLLAWADDLADDGYRDPRLPEWPNALE